MSGLGFIVAQAPVLMLLTLVALMWSVMRQHLPLLRALPAHRQPRRLPRAAAAEHLGMLAVTIDLPTNAAAQGDTVVSPPGAAVATVVVGAREDLEIARQVRGVLSGVAEPRA